LRSVARSFSGTVYLEQRGYAPATIKLRLAAGRRAAYEAVDAGLLSPELVAGTTSQEIILMENVIEGLRTLSLAIIRQRVPQSAGPADR